MIQDTRQYGVSDALGYILVFSITLSSVLVAFTVGLPELEQAQQNEKIQNVERSFDIIKTNMNDVVWEMESSRSTQIQLLDSTLRGEEQQELTVTTEDFDFEYQHTPFKYETNAGTDFVYENGAVIRVDETQSTIIQEPRFSQTGDTVLVPSIQTRQIGESVSGGIREIQKERFSDGFTERVSVDSDTTISITTQYPQAWEEYLTSQQFIEFCNRSDSQVTCEFTDEVETLQIRTIAVNIEFQ